MGGYRSGSESLDQGDGRRTQVQIYSRGNTDRMPEGWGRKRTDQSYAPCSQETAYSNFFYKISDS